MNIKLSDKEDAGNENKVSEEVYQRMEKSNTVDSIYGYEEHKNDIERVGWLVNMKPTDYIDQDNNVVSAMVYYFIEEDGKRFKSVRIFKPYFYICTKKECEGIVENELRKKYDLFLYNIEIIEKEDLDLDNHLSGIKRKFMKLSFHRVEDLVAVRRELMPRIVENRKRAKEENNYINLLTEHLTGDDSAKKGIVREWINFVTDIREYDVPYHVRVSIDLNIFIGKWYTVQGCGQYTNMTERNDIVYRPDPIVLAYDIETTKLPLKFPDSTFDQIMMISYMLDGQGYLICNREIISENIENFEFTPRPEFPGPFIVYNESNEKATIVKFFEHIRDVKPNLFVSYNGDFFDWPFVEARAVVHGIDMFERIGFSKDSQDEYKSRPSAHMDALQWVKRDSYLPIGARGLKPVCKAKLRYDPVEVDPEDMVKLAREQPRTLANYSVSDAVATYYLYMRYVHPFIFALCTIIPMDPDEVLRKGSGTLCESLLMVQAFKANIIFPNKQESKLNELTPDGHLLKSETYVGGHVEALESGVFRSDVPTKFRVVPEMCQHLREQLRNTLKHALTVEENVDLTTVVNFDEVVSEVDAQLENLQQTPNRFECPIIYHLDVAAMYPNIILSNRLQPSAVIGNVNEDRRCAACDFNTPSARCQRAMQWMWRGEVMPATRSEYYLIQSQLEREKFPPKDLGGSQRVWYQLKKEEQAAVERERLEKYCRNEYKRRQDTRLETRTSVVCQKENSFYVDTVRAFRDRRYEFKGLTKEWKKKLDNLIASAGDAAEIKHANGMLVLYDSLQLAHKCILNSFYGYVMRRGARWYSMEMAGIVCHTGANIIRKARELIEQVGRPLELDTDGVWCILPASFPENVVFEISNVKRSKVTISYPGAMLNVMVQTDFTNDQYHDLIDAVNKKYSIRHENSIFFEVDGPYKAMILPASKEQGKKLKKRYAVFNFDGSLAELKGFEVKRNGELNLIKIFQSSVFESFLQGTTLEEIYNSVAEVANYWLDMLFTRAEYMADEELFELISERKVMSKKLEEYGSQKSTSISTAKRLAEFLGDEMVKDSGLSFKYVISKRPVGLQVTERAIPTAIFQAEESVKRHFLRKWLKCPELENFDIRYILDWNYYIERFSSNIQKIITIPAALQGVPNPIPRVPHPDWLQKRLLEKDDTFKQRRIDELFAPVSKEEAQRKIITDIEEMATRGCNRSTVSVSRLSTMKRKQPQCDKENTSAVNDKGQLISENWRDILLVEQSKTIPIRGNSLESWRNWLSFHRKKWAIQKMIKQRSSQKQTDKNQCDHNQLDMGEPNFKKFKGGRQTNMSEFVSQTRASLFRDTWQIIQLSETATSGVYRIWVLLGNSGQEQQLISVRLQVPRTFYVNTRVSKDDLISADNRYFRRVHKTLPRSRPVVNLYEYVIDEPTFLENEAAIRAEFVKNEVEGVYELEVPLIFRVLVRLGCLCAVDKSTLSNNMSTASSTSNATFVLNNLKQRSTAQHAYLVDAEHSLSHVFLFQLKISKRNGIIAVFVPSQKKATLIIIGPAIATASNLPTPGFVLSQLFKEREESLQPCSQHERSHNYLGGGGSQLIDLNKFSEYSADSIDSVDVLSDVNESSAFKRTNKLLLNYKQNNKQATLLITVTKSSLIELSKGITAIAEFPAIPLTDYSEIDSNVFSALDWQKVAVKNCLQAYLRYPSQFSVYLDRARYLHVPVGNLMAYQPGTDNCCDLLYARYLVKQDHILWCSSGSSDPDLGGKETEDRRLMLVDAAADKSSALLTRNMSGMYRGVCLAMELSYVPVNTLIAMPRIQELDGDYSIGGRGIELSSIDEMLRGSVSGSNGTDPRNRNLNLSVPLTAYDDIRAVGPAFRVLRTMVLGWIEDITKYHNRIADELVVHLLRWLGSRSALLHDPALTRSLMRLSARLMCRLTDWLSGFGLQVLHCSCSRLIVATGKTQLADALLLVKHAYSSMREADLFAALELRFLGGWDVLLWRDPYNFSGVVSDSSGLTEQQDATTELISDSLNISSSQSTVIFEPRSTSSDQLENRWHLQRYISPSDHPLQRSFLAVMRYYLLNLWRIIHDELQLAGIDDGIGGNCPENVDAANFASTKSRIERFISEDMSFFLYTTVSDLAQNSRVNKQKVLLDSETDFSLPLLPLLKKEVDNPLEEFVKTICYVLSLDDQCNSQAYSWKRNMLKLIGSFECVESCKWESPYSVRHNQLDLSTESGMHQENSLLIVIPELICDNCYAVKDLDLCRHTACVYNNETDSWWYVCSACESELSRVRIESALLDQINSMAETTLLQDLQCSKCSKNVGSMRKGSAGGILETTFARSDNCQYCGHRITVTVDTEYEIQNRIRIYRDMGHQYGMLQLEMVTSKFLSN